MLFKQTIVVVNANQWMPILQEQQTSTEVGIKLSTLENMSHSKVEWKDKLLTLLYRTQGLQEISSLYHLTQNQF